MLAAKPRKIAADAPAPRFKIADTNITDPPKRKVEGACEPRRRPQNSIPPGLSARRESERNS
jgi:hypothetical protein